MGFAQIRVLKPQFGIHSGFSLSWEVYNPNCKIDELEEILKACVQIRPMHLCVLHYSHGTHIHRTTPNPCVSELLEHFLRWKVMNSCS